MPNWMILTITVPLFFVVYQSIAKLLPKATSLFLVNTYAFLVGSIIMLILHLSLSPDKSFSLPTKSLFIAMAIGVLLSLGNFGIFKTFSLGAPQSLFSIIFYISLMIYGVIFGVLFWKETLNLPQILGAMIAIAGIIIMVYFKK